MRLQVMVYFDKNLYRANRCTKVDSVSANAFDSPNYPPLANTDLTTSGVVLKGSSLCTDTDLKFNGYILQWAIIGNNFV